MLLNGLVVVIPAGGYSGKLCRWIACLLSCFRARTRFIVITHTALAPARSTDMIVGFCGESEGDHAASLDLMRSVAFDQAFMYAYSLREKTHAARNYQARSRSSL
jgi:hypothetical protein